MRGAQLVRSAGNMAQLMAKENGYALVRLPSGEMRNVRLNLSLRALCLRVFRPDVCSSDLAQLVRSAGNMAQLDVVDDGTDGDVLEGQSVTGLDVGVGAGHDLVANLQTIGSQDVALGAVLVLNECDEGGTVRVILQRLDSGGDIKLVALEVDDTVLDAVAVA